LFLGGRIRVLIVVSDTAVRVWSENAGLLVARLAQEIFEVFVGLGGASTVQGDSAEVWIAGSGLSGRGRCGLGRRAGGV